VPADRVIQCPKAYEAGKGSTPRPRVAAVDPVATKTRPGRALIVVVVGAVLAACSNGTGSTAPTTPTSATKATTVSTDSGASPTTVPPPTETPPPPPTPTGPPPAAGPPNVYANAGANMMSPNVAGAQAYVYVPSAAQNSEGWVDVIDQATMQVINRFKAGSISQHVVPSWDLKTLYVTASAANQLVPIDPQTGEPGTPIAVPRPYNLYFTPDGTRAVVQVEQNDRIEYYDTATWTKTKSIAATCDGNNHADWSADGSYFLVTCEFSGDMIKVDTATGDIVDKINLAPGAMPQDVRLTPDGTKFYVADMMSDGVWIVDGNTMTVLGHIDTGKGTHGVYPSRDGTRMYVTNRGRHMGDEKRRSRPGEGSVSVVDPTTDTVVATWTVPGGGSPDMGGVSADGTRLWLSGRYDSEVYVFDTSTGELVGRIETDPSPHGLAVWPQPGQYSLGHTGNTR
jgi:YVTN family beta-propeller protein